MSDEFEVEFNINGVDSRVFYGVNDRNLKIIEQHFPVCFSGRGEIVRVSGSSVAVKKVEELLSELIFILNRNKKLSRSDILTAIQIIKEESKDKNSSGIAKKELETVVYFTEDGYVGAETPGQIEYFNAVKKNDIVFCIGPAGTGKTYLAVAMALLFLKNKTVSKIILARPAVEAGENLGYLPGDFREKIDPYLRPLYDALLEMLPGNVVKKYIEQGIIEVIPMAFMRGRTLNNAFVLLDEAQNCSYLQMKMFLTRLGYNSKSIINGDITQIDLPDKNVSGLVGIKEILNGIDGIKFINLESDDVMRHKLVKKIINAYAKQENNKNSV